MSVVKVQANSSGTGIFTIAAPNSNIDRTLTLPDNTGTLVTNVAGSVSQTMLATNVAGNGPAFAAFQNASTSITNNVSTKILFGTESFDTNNNFSSSTFTPTVAGFYQINAKVAFSVNGTNTRFVALFKNGSKVSDIAVGVVNGLNYAEVGGSFLIQMNGSTDFLEIFASQNSGSTLTTDGGSNTYFQASMVRAA